MRLKGIICIKKPEHFQQQEERMRQTEPLYFYTSKKVYFWIIPLLSLFIGGALLAGYGLQHKEWWLIGIGVFVMFVFNSVLPICKRLLKRQPYIVLTEESFMINQPYRGSVFIDWADVSKFELVVMQMRQLVFVQLHNEEEYRKQVAKKSLFKKKPSTVMRISPFWIVWAQVKKKDQELLAHELNRLSDNQLSFNEGTRKMLDEEGLLEFVNTDNLPEQLEKEKNERKKYRQKDGKYFLKAYGYSLLLSIGAIFINNLESGGSGDLARSVPFLIVSFLLFPFAKFIFDEIIGSKINYHLKKDSIGPASYYLFPLMLIIYGLIYMFSVFIAPVGILYFLLKVLYKKR